MSKLPEDCIFAYYVSHEAWYYTSAIGGPEIMVTARSEDGGCAWEFGVRQVRDIAIRVEVFSDAWAAFAQIPEFFATLAEEGADTLDAVREILDRLGAKDITDRDNLYPDRPSPAAIYDERERQCLVGALQTIAHGGSASEQSEVAHAALSGEQS